jgi:hypothetical protein
MHSRTLTHAPASPRHTTPHHATPRHTTPRRHRVHPRTVEIADGSADITCTHGMRWCIAHTIAAAHTTRARMRKGTLPYIRAIAHVIRWRCDMGRDRRTHQSREQTTKCAVHSCALRDSLKLDAHASAANGVASM